MKLIRKISFSVAAIFALCISIYFALFYSAEKLDQLALSETKKIINEIGNYRKNNGRFPENVKQLMESKGLKTNIRFGVLSTNIKLFIHDGSHLIEYHQAQFGPFHGYSFKTKEWYSTE